MSQHLHKPPPLDQLEKLPATLRTLVGHMIEKDPAKRPQTPAELRSELEKCLASLQLGGNAAAQDFPTVTEETRPISAEKLTPVAHPPKSLRLVGLLVGATVFIAAICLFAFFKLRSGGKVVSPGESFASPGVSAIPQISAPPSATIATASPAGAPKTSSPVGLTTDREVLLKNAILKA